MIIIWAILGVLLIVLVVGGFVGRSRKLRRTEEHVTHHGKDAHNHRGRGRH